MVAASGCGAAHAAEARRDDEPARETAAEVPPGTGGERLVGSLQDALRADVNPAAGRHLAEHRQAHRFEPAKLLPGRPLAAPASCWRSARAGPCSCVRTTPTGLPDWTSSVSSLSSLRSVGDDGVERLPGARRLAGAAVDDEVVGIFGDLGIEVVHQHAQGRFLDPALAGAFGAARGVERPGMGDRGHDGASVGRMPSVILAGKAREVQRPQRNRPIFVASPEGTHRRRLSTCSRASACSRPLHRPAGRRPTGTSASPWAARRAAGQPRRPAATGRGLAGGTDPIASLRRRR